MTTINDLIPLVKELKNSNYDFPVGFCDILTYILTTKRSGVLPLCGYVENTSHFWIKLNDLNIDFTAHQFPSLIRFTQQLDGCTVLIGSDKQLLTWGYHINPPNYCGRELKAVTSPSLGSIDNCSDNLCLLK